MRRVRGARGEKRRGGQASSCRCDARRELQSYPESTVGKKCCMAGVNL